MPTPSTDYQRGLLSPWNVLLVLVIMVIAIVAWYGFHGFDGLKHLGATGH